MRVQKVCKELKMMTVEAQAILRQMVGPYRDRQRTLERFARRLGWPYSRTFNIFYGRAKRIDAHEWIKLNEEFAELTNSARSRLGALHELEILERAAVEAHRPDHGQVDVEGGAPSQARFGCQRLREE